MSRKMRLPLLLTIVTSLSILVVAALRQNRNAVTPGQNHPSTRANDETIRVPQVPQIASEGGPRQHLTVSPSGHLLVYHNPFNPYGSSPEPLVFTVVDARTGKAGLKIPIEWPARFVSSVRWIDDRFVLVQGERAFLAILDVKSGKQTHSLVGLDFSVSSDETKMAYRYDFNPLRGYVPPEHQSDYVLFTPLQRTPGSGPPGNNYKVIYPDPLPWGKADPKIYTDLDQRHEIRSDLVWSPDSQMIAFIERNQRRLWLTVLKLEVLNGGASVNPKRFDLGMVSESKLAVSWYKNAQVRVNGSKSSWRIDLTSGRVMPST